MKNVMKAAHQMTKEIKAEYPNVNYKFQLGLCISYLAKKGENEMITDKTYNFKTAKGAEIELRVRYSNGILLANVKMNGKDCGDATIQKETQTVKFPVDKQFAMTQIPAEMFAELYAPQAEKEAEHAARFEEELKIEEEYQANYNKVMRTMNR